VNDRHPDGCAPVIAVVAVFWIVFVSAYFLAAHLSPRYFTAAPAVPAVQPDGNGNPDLPKQYRDPYVQR
jgi:hypothetical protein